MDIISHNPDFLGKNSLSTKEKQVTENDSLHKKILSLPIKNYNSV